MRGSVRWRNMRFDSARSFSSDSGFAALLSCSSAFLWSGFRYFSVRLSHLFTMAAAAFGIASTEERLVYRSGDRVLVKLR